MDYSKPVDAELFPEGCERCSLTKFTGWMSILGVVFLWGLYAAVRVLGFGLGETGMDDYFGFGLWITFDLAVIALGAGAFFTGALRYILNIDELKKNYGMKLKEEGLDPNVGANYKSALFQSGAQIKMNLKTSINEKFFYETQLVLFTDYLNKPFRYNRINWDNKITWQFTKFFKIGLSTWLIYDPIVLIDGRQQVQFKEPFSINFTWLITNK